MRDLSLSSSPCLLEPFMNVEIVAPENIIGDLMSDISGNRGGRVLGIKNVKARFSDDGDNVIDESRRNITVLLPLSEMVGYNTYLRSLSKGEASF